jgi:predicted nucleic acid-binding protein
MDKKMGGSKHAPLPDLFIGAPAAAGGMARLTRDPARCRTYLPRLRAIAP